jgi:hypothetical protein
MQIQSPPPRQALYVPGLFISMKCKNYAVLYDAFAEHDQELEFLDFSFAYNVKNFSYKALVKETAERIKGYKTIITYSLGSNIALDALHAGGHEQPENVVFLSPVGNPEKSSFGAKAKEWKRDGYRKSRPTDYFPGGFDMPYSFYEEKVELYKQNTIELTSNTLAVIGKQDHVISYDIVEDMEKIGVKTLMIDDVHPLTYHRQALPGLINGGLQKPLWE